MADALESMPGIASVFSETADGYLHIAFTEAEVRPWEVLELVERFAGSSSKVERPDTRLPIVAAVPIRRGRPAVRYLKRAT